MKNLCIVFGIVLLLSAVPAFGQGTYFLDYYANNAGPIAGASDQTVRIVNTGIGGTPLTSPVGDICTAIYVFDNNQEMISCCTCRMTPNALASASVGTQLTNNPLTSVVPAAGVIKIVTVPTISGCNPIGSLDGANAALAAVFGTHLEVVGGATFVTETEKLSSPLSVEEALFLPNACSFVRYLGSGKGTCSCTGGDVH